jgi:succinate dehydrogenase/fumarate reductase flavoprotein subunit
METTRAETCDFLIVGGGAAGCMAAIRAKELNPDIEVAIVEKAEISRSGAAGHAGLLPEQRH